MTKRSRKHREEKAARLAAEAAAKAALASPGPAPRQPAPLADHGLRPKESLELELRALREDWLGGDKFATVRTALMHKAASLGLQSENPEVVTKVLRAVAQTEQRQRQLQLQAYALSMRPQRGSDPDAVPEPLQGLPAPEAQRAPKPFEIIQELIRNRDVRNALHGGPAEPSESGDVRGGAALSQGSAPGAAGA